MATSVKKKSFAIALIAGSLVAGTATLASATPQGQEIIKSLVTWGGGATDLKGNDVESKTFVGDILPDDLGELEYSGTATVTE
jgi:hypothetical protein